MGTAFRKIDLRTRGSDAHIEVVSRRVDAERDIRDNGALTWLVGGESAFCRQMGDARVTLEGISEDPFDGRVTLCLKVIVKRAGEKVGVLLCSG
jgi:hypothetical protein